MKQELFATVDILCDGGIFAALSYFLLHKNGRYGVQVVLCRGGKYEESSAYDLTDSRTTALALLELLRRNTVTPCTLGDVLSDRQEKNAKKDRHLGESLVK